MTEIRKAVRRAACLGLAASMTIMTGIHAFAQAGALSCDEAMYVTMDAYGNIKETSVVKSYDLHGSKQVVDYGTYSEINNMSDYTNPVVEDGKVTFSLDTDPENGRFYFEGKTDPEQTAKDLPWNLTVSYKLNGVEKNIEDLIHEKGMVEIFIDAVPNPDASEYYKNNMTLEIATAVDMEKNLSLEAPGAQVQSLGNLKAVLFMILPGEEQHYEIRIGSNDFEFSGLAFMMVPVTLSQLDNLEDLRDARDTVKDSADAIYDSLDVILDSLDGLSDGLSGTVEGLKKLDESRQTLANAKDGIYVNADTALDILKELSDRGIPFTTYVQDAQNALSDANRDINALNDTVNDLDSHLSNLGWGLRNVNRDLDDVTDLLNDGRRDIRQWENKLASLRRDLEDLKKYKELSNQKLEELKKLLNSLKNLQDILKEHGDVLGITDEQLQKLLEDLEALTGEAVSDELKGQIVQIASDSNAAIKDVVGNILQSGVLDSPTLKQLIALIEGLIGEAEQVSVLDDMISDVQKSISTIENILERVNVDGESLENVLGDTGDLADTLKRSTVTGQDLITNVNQLTTTLNTYHETAVNAMGDAGRLIDSAVRGTDAMYILMKDVENNLKAAGTPLNEGSKATIDGLSSALNSAIDGLSKTGVIKDAKDTVQDLIEDKWNEYTGEDMTILNVDANAKKVSFTSNDNPEPQSLQIILRTEGTAEKEDEMEAEVDESFHPEGNFLQRLWSILIKIVDTIKGIFK